MFLWSHDRQSLILQKLCMSRPYAVAKMKGSPRQPDIMGTVSFYPVDAGTVVSYDFIGLPFNRGNCGDGIHAIHIHGGGSCTGNMQDPFQNAGVHYNPKDCEHPYHAGDMPPIFANVGYAWGAFYTERFSIKDVIGKTVVLHERPDDFKSQPAGDSGAKIACGVIMKL